MALEKFSLKEKSGIVTGGGSGIGKSISKAVVQAGAEIVIVGRNKERLEKTERELQSFGGPVIPLQDDVSRMEDIRFIVNHTLKEFGKIDFLFNNAGIIRRTPSEDFSDSLISVQGGKRVPAYAASKGGLSQLTKAMANDWAKYNILVNAIGPGWVKTDLTETLRQDKDRYNEILGRIPLGRWAEPEDLMGVTVFLTSNASNYITGQTISVDGGWLSM